MSTGILRALLFFLWLSPLLGALVSELTLGAFIVERNALSPPVGSLAWQGAAVAAWFLAEFVLRSHLRWTPTYGWSTRFVIFYLMWGFAAGRYAYAVAVTAYTWLAEDSSLAAGAQEATIAHVGEDYRWAVIRLAAPYPGTELIYYKVPWYSGIRAGKHLWVWRGSRGLVMGELR